MSPRSGRSGFSSQTPGSLQTYLLFTIFAEQAPVNRNRDQRRKPFFSSKDIFAHLNTSTGATSRIGGAERDRTADPLLAKQVLSQLSYSPNRFDSQHQSQTRLNQNGGPGQTRTADLTLIRRAL